MPVGLEQVKDLVFFGQRKFRYLALGFHRTDTFQVSPFAKISRFRTCPRRSWSHGSRRPDCSCSQRCGTQELMEKAAKEIQLADGQAAAVAMKEWMKDQPECAKFLTGKAPAAHPDSRS